jgi:hypothetical protein
VFSDIAACIADKAIHVDAIAVYVVEEDLVAVSIRPVVTEVDHSAAVSVTATCIGSVVLDTWFMAPPSVVADVSSVVEVICDGFDVVEDVSVEVLTGLTLVVGTLDHMVEVWDDARRYEGLSVVVEVHTPWITGAPSEDFESVFCGVVSPDGGVHRNTVFVWCARFADFAMGKYAVAAIQPTVGAPIECVQRFVGVLVTETIEKDLWLGIRGVIAVCIGDKHQVWSCTDPYTAEPDFETTDEI